MKALSSGWSCITLTLDEDFKLRMVVSLMLNEGFKLRMVVYYPYLGWRLYNTHTPLRTVGCYSYAGWSVFDIILRSVRSRFMLGGALNTHPAQYGLVLLLCWMKPSIRIVVRYSLVMLGAGFGIFPFQNICVLFLYWMKPFDKSPPLREDTFYSCARDDVLHSE